jgi:hypothetical protein
MDFRIAAAGAAPSFAVDPTASALTLPLALRACRGTDTAGSPKHAEETYQSTDS